MDTIRKKLVIVGDGCCGKTSLVYAFCYNKFLSEHQPTLVETCTVNVLIDDKTVEFVVWDTAGQEEYERLRPICYKETHIVLVCYSIDLPDSLSNVVEKWYPELRYFCPLAPIVLVGVKKDLRNDPITVRRLKLEHKRPTQTNDGQLIAKKINAIEFFECSCKTTENINCILKSAARIVLSQHRRRIFSKSKCLNECVML